MKYSLCRLVSECFFEARTGGWFASYLSVLRLTRQLTFISGNLRWHSLRGARAERIECLLCDELKLIGSKKAKNAAKAGDMEAMLLLPNQLNKTDRSKILDSYERQVHAAAPALSAPEPK